MKASWLQSCRIPRLGQGLCFGKGPGILIPQTPGLTDSRFHREPNKLCSIPMVLNEVHAETERYLESLTQAVTQNKLIAYWNKHSSQVCPKPCDLVCFLTSIHSDSKHLGLSSSVSLMVLFLTASLIY